ncbi:MAG: CAP domain-containing protein [Planctomycetota bacterium]|nr:CAP domain-containing protein [Planctomycetota bacterium]
MDSVVGEEKDTPPGTQMTADERSQALRVADMVNRVRAANGLQPLTWDETAADAAYDHAVSMRVGGFYAHVAPDGRTPLERLRDAEVEFDFFGGENIAKGNEGPDAVMAAWVGSPQHLHTLLGPGLTHIGVGVHDGRDGPWWVQEFFVRID